MRSQLWVEAGSNKNLGVRGEKTSFLHNGFRTMISAYASAETWKDATTASETALTGPTMAEYLQRPLRLLDVMLSGAICDVIAEYHLSSIYAKCAANLFVTSSRNRAKILPTSSSCCWQGNAVSRVLFFACRILHYDYLPMTGQPIAWLPHRNGELHSMQLPPEKYVNRVSRVIATSLSIGGRYQHL